MKFVLKNILLFAALSVVFSALLACNRATTTGVNDSTSVNPADSPGEKNKGNYPPAPSAIMQSEIKLLDGSTLKLPDKKGKVVLVNLWATWCGPCRGEMPHFIELQDKYKDKGLEIIGLDVDEETREDIEAFAAKNKLNYTLGWADTKLNLEFVKLSKLQGIPQTIVIDREGRLNGVFAGGGPKTIDQMKQTVERLVSE